MSLTDDQITAQNFKDFYQQILPYLNGNSPICTNLFNKSDLYDTTEKIVGRWIDGKPIYLKVLVLETNVQQNGWIPYPNNTIDILIKYGGTAYFRTERHKRPFPWDVEGNYANINSWNSNGLEYSTNASMNVLMSGSMIWLMYTKTNDTQMSISDGNEYSLDEQIIGHWINGKPIYQKSFTATITTANTTTPVATNLFSTYNIDEIVGFDGILTEYNGVGSGKGALPLTYAYFNGTGDMHTAYVSNDGNLYTCGRYRGKVVYHLRYTKTTD